VEAPQPSAAIMQVAPRPQPGLAIKDELWATDADHYTYVDLYGNRCERFELPTGAATVIYEAHVVVRRPDDVIVPDARETPTASLPDDVLNFVMPSRFCLPDELGGEAWQRFGQLTPGWSRVQAVVDHVHQHLTFTPGASNPWTTAADANRAGQGVCRDFAHLAITFCRALNIPARYVFGYIPDIEIPVMPPDSEPMDFCAWFEVYLGGKWWIFDARNNERRKARLTIARGRDALDVAMLTTYGNTYLNEMIVIADPAEDDAIAR
jgi:transglutaminase-like putative cysteine protease